MLLTTYFTPLTFLRDLLGLVFLVLLFDGTGERDHALLSPSTCKRAALRPSGRWPV